jgi:hypothetical protein
MATPQACAWSTKSESWRVPFVAQWARLHVRCSEPDAPGNLFASLFRLEDRIGFSTAGLAEMGWKVAVDETAAKRHEKKPEPQAHLVARPHEGRQGGSGADQPVDFPTLGFLAADWIEAHCSVPSGHDLGPRSSMTAGSCGARSTTTASRSGIKFNPGPPDAGAGRSTTAARSSSAHRRTASRPGRRRSCSSRLSARASSRAGLSAARSTAAPSTAATATSSSSTSRATRWGCRGEVADPDARRPPRRRPRTSTSRSRP